MFCGFGLRSGCGFEFGCGIWFVAFLVLFWVYGICWLGLLVGCWVLWILFLAAGNSFGFGLLWLRVFVLLICLTCVLRFWCLLNGLCLVSGFVDVLFVVSLDWCYIGFWVAGFVWVVGVGLGFASGLLPDCGGLLVGCLLSPVLRGVVVAVVG